MKPIVDMSSHQPPDLINYQALSAEVEGVILRACYGNRKDVHFDRHYQELHAMGLPMGAYIYVTNYMTAQSQVQTLLDAIRGKELPLGIWVDVELETGAERLTKQKVHEVIQLLEAALGYQVGLYTSAYYWGEIMGGAYYTNRRLWVAAYGYQTPPLPTGWTTWWLWQHTDKGRLPGYPSNLDLNHFNGTLDQFNAWVNKETQPEPTPPLTSLLHPTREDARISQYFGANPPSYPTSRGHNGIDYAILTGTPVYAAADGTVERAEKLTTGYGRHVRIRHSHGVTIYGHLNQYLVNVGNQVKAGDLIGFSGGDPGDPYSGFSTGQHLHFEYRWDQPAPQVPGGFVYNAVDPLPLINSKKEPPMNFEIVVICNSMNVRSGPGIGYQIVSGIFNGDRKPVFEERNGWYRIGTGKWISGNPAYVTRIDPPTPVDPVDPPIEPDLEVRVKRLEFRVTAIEDALAE